MGMAGEDANEIYEKAIELGFMAAAQADAAVNEFKRSKEPNFASFLLQRGLVDLAQLAELQPMADAMEATMVGLASSADPIVGKTFSDCTVERKLGQGGMGAVYLAIRESDAKEVVVKFLAQEQAADPAWRGRFLREAEVMRRISHPNIVGIFDVEGEIKAPYIVMEFVDGSPLEDVIEDGPIEPKEAARIGRDIALALAHAHDAGVIHRDIKPANVLLSKTGEVKVLDFGLAKSVESDDGLSLPGQILGTPYYMAPEQWGDHMVDSRCDVFSLGATLYHLVTGVVPFQGKSPQAISRKVMKGQFAPPRAMVPDMPADLELAIFRMMERDRRFRYRNATECAEALDQVLKGKEVDVPRLIALSQGRPTGKRYALLPGGTFTLGREASCSIEISDRSVSRQHAQIERGNTGYVLRDLGSSYGSFVSGMRIREVVLKNEDQIKLGKVEFRFHDGGLGQATLTTRRVSEDRLLVRTSPASFVDTLVSMGDRRIVQHLLEVLAPQAVDDQVTMVRAILRLQVGGDFSERIGSALETRLRKKRLRAPRQLFTITHENLSDDIDSWLAWWDQARASFPAQVGPQSATNPARLLVTAGEPTARAVPLDKGTMFGVGRDESSAVRLDSRSVSRLHATIFRFHKRFVLRDEGSRFGTLVNGERTRLCFLKTGDRIVLGKVELTFEVDKPDASATMADADVLPIEPEAFFAMVEQEEASVASGLIGFIRILEDASWIREEARALFPDNGEKAENLASILLKRYQKEANRAHKLLPQILGPPPTDSVLGWEALLDEKLVDLPVQFVPQGWFPLSAD